MWPTRFKSFDLVIGNADNQRSIAKVKFAKNGTIYVLFHGFVSSQGVLSKIVMQPGEGGPVDKDLSQYGVVTSHQVKFSYHADGRVHFSQDGKVLTVIQRESTALDTQIGHLCTIQAQSIDSFSAPKNKDKQRLTFTIEGEIQAVKLVIQRLPMSALNVPEDTPQDARPLGIDGFAGGPKAGLFVAPPVGFKFDDHVLFISAETTNYLSSDQKPILMFLGGFDHQSIALDHSSATEFLAFSYPCSDFEALKQKIECIDYLGSGSASKSA